jgi:uncharacterized membrane protein
METSLLPALLKTVHFLAVVVWVGGMFFAHVCLRPAVALLEAPMRLRLLHAVFRRFLLVVAVAALAVLVSGFWMTKLAAQSGFGMPWQWSAMAAIGVLMVIIFVVIRFLLYAGLDRAVAGGDWSAARSAVVKIRQAVLVNLVLGLATIVMVGLAGG